MISGSEKINANQNDSNYQDNLNYFSDDNTMISFSCSYLVEDTNECINTCDINEYYIDEETKTCVKNCPSHLERGFYDSNKKCVKCGIEGTGNGFHIENEKECLTSCEGYKYNYQNNICFESSQGCSKDDYIYSALDKNNICYKSCADIDEGSYKYEINSIICR